MANTIITVAITINAPVEKVWDLWIGPEHIICWNFASDDWHSPKAENDLRVGGRFSYRMEPKDGGEGFDFSGEYTKVDKHSLIEYKLDDGRNVQIIFSSADGKTTIKESFEAENENSVELQREGWQSILDNFRRYAENLNRFIPLHFEILINASPEKVYKTMLDKKQYSEWTAVFNPASHYIGSWEKGSKILFIGEDKDGNAGGMVSQIKENLPNRFVSIEHKGVIHGQKEITSGPEVEAWAGGKENYSFTAKEDKTLLSVDVDSNSEFKGYFDEIWPKALSKLKSICEAE